MPRRPLFLVVSPEAALAAGIAAHLRARAEVKSCADTLQAEPHLRAEQFARRLSAWLKLLPRVVILNLLTCGGVFLVGVATLFLLYLFKSFLGIGIFRDPHLSSLWRQPIRT